MASADLFQATPSLKKAAALINNLENGKFARVLSRVVQKLHLKNAKVFTSEEEEKLQGALQLDPKELELVINTTTFILQQAAYHLAKPSLLKSQLAAIGLAEEKIQVLIQGWSSQGKATVEKLRSSTFYPKQLEEVNWRQNLTMAQTGRSKLKQPNALFEFVIKEGEEREKVQVEFTHEELYAFYSKLESIQDQLDSLA